MPLYRVGLTAVQDLIDVAIDTIEAGAPADADTLSELNAKIAAGDVAINNARVVDTDAIRADLAVALPIRPVTVDTVAALRTQASPVASGVAAQTLGYYANGDGGGATYRWDAASSAADNGGTVIVPSAAPALGRWIMVLGAVVSVLQFGAKADAGATDSLPAFVAAMATGKQVDVPNVGSWYTWSTELQLVDGARFIGIGKPMIQKSSTSRFLRFFGISKAEVRGFVFDSSNDGLTSNGTVYCQNATDCIIEDNDFVRPYSYLILYQACKRNRVKGNSFTNGLSTFMEMNGTDCSDNEVTHNFFADGVGFGIRMLAGAHHNLIAYNTTHSNGIELIGLNHDAHHNRIIGNHAEGCSDNGISITGYCNVVMGNVCVGNTNSGIFLFGRDNVCVGNTCKNNGSMYATNGGLQWAGIQISGRFGGTGQGNVVSGNFCDDDQSPPTQYDNIRVEGVFYPSWATATAYAAGSYIKNDLNIYYSATGGTSGAAAPVHSSGTVSDGAVSWEHLDAFQGGMAECWDNRVSGNRVGRCVSGLEVHDLTVNHANLIEFCSATQYFQNSAYTPKNLRVSGTIEKGAQLWTDGVAVTYGSHRYSGQNVYRCVNAGGIMATGSTPVHGAGVVIGADGIAWQHVIGNSRYAPLLQLSSDEMSARGRFLIENIDTLGSYASFFHGSGAPEGLATGIPGSKFYSASGRAHTKYSGAGATGWIADAPIYPCTTATRPTGLNATTDCGFPIYDLTIGATRYWNGAAWEDANGRLDSSTGLTAAGTTQGTALALAEAVNEVTTAAAGSGVKLKAAIAGASQIIHNRGANYIYVYPATGEAINALGANVPFPVLPGERFEFVCRAVGQWYAPWPHTRTLASGAGTVPPHTGTTSETPLLTVPVPGGIMGAMGVIEIKFYGTQPTSANTKTWRAHLNTIGDTAVLASGAMTTVTVCVFDGWIANKNSQSLQIGAAYCTRTIDTIPQATAGSGAFDMSVAKDLIISGQLASAAETMTLQSWSIKIVRA